MGRWIETMEMGRNLGDRLKQQFGRNHGKRL
jgi:hypothetical protein